MAAADENEEESDAAEEQWRIIFYDSVVLFFFTCLCCVPEVSVCKSRSECAASVKYIPDVLYRHGNARRLTLICVRKLTSMCQEANICVRMLTFMPGC